MGWQQNNRQIAGCSQQSRVVAVPTALLQVSNGVQRVKLFRRHTQPVSSTDKQQQFLALLQPVYDGLYRFIYALTRNRDKADDLMSETILQAYERFETVRDKQAFFSFVLTIARRTHKRREWRARLFVFDNDTADLTHGQASSPEIATDTELMLNALNDLPEKQREALILFEISGFSIEEICAVQGGSISGVKSRLARGRQKLAELLGHNEPTQDAKERAISATDKEPRNVRYSSNSLSSTVLSGSIAQEATR